MRAGAPVAKERARETANLQGPSGANRPLTFAGRGTKNQRTVRRAEKPPRGSRADYPRVPKGTTQRFKPSRLDTGEQPGSKRRGTLSTAFKTQMAPLRAIPASCPRGSASQAAIACPKGGRTPRQSLPRNFAPQPLEGSGGGRPVRRLPGVDPDGIGVERGQSPCWQGRRKQPCSDPNERRTFAPQRSGRDRQRPRGGMEAMKCLSVSTEARPRGTVRSLETGSTVH
jgi:hypothetical protein